MAGYKSDIEIAQEATMLPISEVAAKVGLTDDQLEHYGKYKAKVDINSMASLTSGKKRYADVQDRIDEIIPKMEEVRARLIDLAQADAEAFTSHSQAYALPRGTEEERARKAEVMEESLLDDGCEKAESTFKKVERGVRWGK